MCKTGGETSKCGSIEAVFHVPTQICTEIKVYLQLISLRITGHRANSTIKAAYTLCAPSVLCHYTYKYMHSTLANELATTKQKKEKQAVNFVGRWGHKSSIQNMLPLELKTDVDD